MTTSMTVDAGRVELLLSELRLPSMKAIWPKLAAQSDKEGWPTAKFLATLAEHEAADRSRRRFERHLAEARLPPGNTLASFDFEGHPDGLQSPGHRAQLRRRLAQEWSQPVDLRPARSRFIVPISQSRWKARVFCRRSPDGGCRRRRASAARFTASPSRSAEWITHGAALQYCVASRIFP